MKINRVRLLNYRCHKNKEVNFGSGVNLLLGANGAGKSSILEAIGLVLFDADIRDSMKDAITRDEKSALLSVEFTGNDYINYRIERRLGPNQFYRLYVENEDSPRLEGKNEICKKVCELSGIENNAANIFKDVITAYQNKITDIFSQTAKLRETTFNQIFNTALYREMYEGFLRTCLDTYRKEFEFTDKKLNELSSKIKPQDELALRRNSFASALSELNILLDKIKSDISVYEKKKEVIESNNRKIIQTKRDIAAKEQLRIVRENEEKSVLADISLSKKALETVENNKAGYNEYLKLSEELKSVSSKIKILEKKKESLHKNERAIADTEKERIACVQKIEGNEKDILEKTSEMEEQTAEATALSGELEKSHSELNLLRAESANISKIFRRFNSELELFEKRRKELENCKRETEIKTANLIDIDKVNEELRIDKEKVDELLKLRNERDTLNSELKKIEARLKDNDEAASALSGGQCPFLKEGCQNIQTGSSAEAFFNLKKQSLEKEYNELKNKLTEFTSVDNDIATVQRSIAVIEKLLADNKMLLIELGKYSVQAESLQKDIENSELRIAAELGKFADVIATKTFEKDYQSIKDELSERLSKLKTLEETNAEFSRNKEQNLLKINGSLTKLLNSVEQKKKEIERFKEQIKSFDGFIDKMNADNQAISNEITILPELHKDEDRLKTSIAELQQSYNLYISELNKANELTPLIKRAEAISKDLETISGDIAKVTALLVELEAVYSEEEHKTIMEQLTKAKASREAKLAEHSEVNKELALIERDIADNEKLRAEKKSASQLRKVLEQKIKLGGIFRDNVNSMGKHVAARLLERIEISATENYRRISGRGEAVRWLNDDKNSYQVFLVNGDNWDTSRRFEMLSGGEQVTVALSLRSALASIMTKANFTIFDEPTVNLDAERRTALADSLYSMLRTLEQAIIVTHDDAFREIAQNVVVL